MRCDFLDGLSYSIGDWVQLFDQGRNRFLRLFLLNRTVLVAGQFFPMACAVSGAPIGFKGCDKFPNNLRFTDDQTKFATRIQLDCTQAAELFGFRAQTSFEDGLRRTVDWYLANREEAEARSS